MLAALMARPALEASDGPSPHGAQMSTGQLGTGNSTSTCARRQGRGGRSSAPQNLNRDSGRPPEVTVTVTANALATDHAPGRGQP